MHFYVGLLQTYCLEWEKKPTAIALPQCVSTVLGPIIEACENAALSAQDVQVASECLLRVVALWPAVHTYDISGLVPYRVAQLAVSGNFCERLLDHPNSAPALAALLMYGVQQDENYDLRMKSAACALRWLQQHGHVMDCCAEELQEPQAMATALFGDAFATLYENELQSDFPSILNVVLQATPVFVWTRTTPTMSLPTDLSAAS